METFKTQSQERRITFRFNHTGASEHQTPMSEEEQNRLADLLHETLVDYGMTQGAVTIDY